MQISMPNGQPALGLLIGERWAPGDGEHLLKVSAPFGGQLLATLRESTPAEVDAAVAQAVTTFAAQELSPFDRARILRRASELIAERAEDFAGSIVAEAGKPIRDALAEVARAVLTFEVCSQEAARQRPLLEAAQPRLCSRIVECE
jgi:acyl-CoA reductase-like NAD-dependent aldehyde dehydrogenase